MNPGGDFGKKELSPALRNRFTEVWVPPLNDPTELRQIVDRRFVLPPSPRRARFARGRSYPSPSERGS
jgi:MoxR-like ATPase